MARIRLLSDADVHATLELEPLIRALERAFIALSEGNASVPGRIAATTEGGGNLLAMPGSIAGALGAKLVTIFGKNHERSLPSHQAVFILFDCETGTPVSIMDATGITSIRTAATTALATRLLARPDSAILAVLGAGIQGLAHLTAVPLVRDFSELRLVSRNRKHAENTASKVTGITVKDTFEEAVEGADVVCACTDSPEPVVKAQWLKPGAHVNSVGFGNGPELDAETVMSSKLYVESRSAFRPRPAGAHELQGVDPESAIELGELLAGRRPGRQREDELTVFKSTGHAAEDLAAAQLIYSAALERDLGMTVDW